MHTPKPKIRNFSSSLQIRLAWLPEPSITSVADDTLNHSLLNKCILETNKDNNGQKGLLIGVARSMFFKLDAERTDTKEKYMLMLNTIKVQNLKCRFFASAPCAWVRRRKIYVNVDRQTDRQENRKTDTQRDTEKEREIHIDIHAGRQWETLTTK